MADIYAKIASWQNSVKIKTLVPDAGSLKK
jgi:hypothetical protein